MASPNCAEIRLAKLRQWHAVCYMIARYMSYQTAHRLTHLVAQRALMGSHKPRDTRQSELTGNFAGLFHARCQTRTNAGLYRYPVDFKRFYRVGIGASGTTPAQKSRVSAAYTKFPTHGSLEKFFL